MAPSRIALRAASILSISQRKGRCKEGPKKLNFFGPSRSSKFGAVPSAPKIAKECRGYDRPPLYSVHRKEQINRIGVEPSLFGIVGNPKAFPPKKRQAVGDTHQALVNHRQTTAHSRPSDLLLIHFARRPRGDEARGGWMRQGMRCMMRCGRVRRPNRCYGMIQKARVGFQTKFIRQVQIERNAKKLGGRNPLTLRAALLQDYYTLFFA